MCVCVCVSIIFFFFFFFFFFNRLTVGMWVPQLRRLYLLCMICNVLAKSIMLV